MYLKIYVNPPSDDDSNDGMPRPINHANNDSDSEDDDDDDVVVVEDVNEQGEEPPVLLG